MLEDSIDRFLQNKFSYLDRNAAREKRQINKSVRKEKKGASYVAGIMRDNWDICQEIFAVYGDFTNVDRIYSRLSEIIDELIQRYENFNNYGNLFFSRKMQEFHRDAQFLKWAVAEHPFDFSMLKDKMPAYEVNLTNKGKEIADAYLFEIGNLQLDECVALMRSSGNL